MIAFVIGISSLINHSGNHCDTLFTMDKKDRKIYSITCYETQDSGKVLAIENLIYFKHIYYHEGYIDSNLNFINHGKMFSLDTFGVEPYIDTGYICHYKHGNKDGIQRNYSKDSNNSRFLLLSFTWCKGRPCGSWYSYYPDTEHSTYLKIYWKAQGSNKRRNIQGYATYFYKDARKKANGQFGTFSVGLPICLRNRFCIIPPESNNWTCESILTPVGKWCFYSYNDNNIITVKFPKTFKEHIDNKIDCSKVKKID
jgi:hypothetical protein